MQVASAGVVAFRAFERFRFGLNEVDLHEMGLSVDERDEVASAVACLDLHGAADVGVDSIEDTLVIRLGVLRDGVPRLLTLEAGVARFLDFRTREDVHSVDHIFTCHAKNTVDIEVAKAAMPSVCISARDSRLESIRNGTRNVVVIASI